VATLFIASVTFVYSQRHETAKKSLKNVQERKSL